MSEMICITCPLGCHLSIQHISETEISVTGNRCSRGEAYAREELLFPKRVVTTTCRAVRRAAAPSSPEAPKVPQVTSLYAPRRVPVRTTGAFPKERIPDLLNLAASLEAPLPVRRGDVLIRDVLGTGIDLIATRTIGNE
jgi:CxxC motif-containing protein